MDASRRDSSGNPKGRPKGSRNFLTLLVQELGQSIVVNENGKKKTMTRMQAMVKRIVAGALGGEQKALLTLVEILRRTGQFEETDMGELLPGDYEAILDTYLAQRQTQRHEESHNEVIPRGPTMKLSKQEEAYLAAIGSDLKVFLRQAFETIYPGKAFLDNWHIDAIVHCLERSIEGHRPRLIINLPPRQLKSFIVSVALPAFILGVDPSAKIICISYSDDLAKALARDFKRIIESAWYRRVFPRCGRPR